MIDRSVLARLDLFRGLNDYAIGVLASGAATRTYEPARILWRAGSKPGDLFIVLEGEVRVVRSSHGRQHVIHTEGVGGTLGDVALFHGSDYPATAITARRTRCLVIGRDVLHEAIRQDPTLALALLERMAGRVRRLVERLDRIAAHTVHARLAAWLLERQAASRGAFTLGTTQLELAEELGTVREVVVRALRHLRDAGLIRSAGRGRYAVTDEASLRAIAFDSRSSIERAPVSQRK
jgi:CRP/FNR family transcriptional regulator